MKENEENKKQSPSFRIFLNPGFIFVMIFVATGIVILKKQTGDDALLFEVSDEKSLESLSAGAYPNSRNNWGDAQPVSHTGKDNYFPADSGGEGINKVSTHVPFQDVTLESGIAFVHTQGGKMLNAISEVVGSGVCMADYDNDGLLDIYAVNGAGYTHYYGKKWWWYKVPHNTLYHNNGDGTFTDVTDKAGVGDKGWGMGCAFGDYDNDGNPDLYITNYGTNVLYNNNGDGSFSDVTVKAGVGDEGWGTSLAWGDYDNDGDLDIYGANYIEFDKTMNPGEPNSAFKREQSLLMDSKLFEGQRNVLYSNNGDGSFTDVTDEAGVGNSPGKSMGVLFSDFNDDGHPDIYITNDKSRNVLYVNSGKGTFTDVGGSYGVDSPLSGMGVTVGDYDNDGDMDIFSTYTQKETNILYKNRVVSYANGKRGRPSSHFVNTTVKAGMGEEVGVGYFGWGTEFLDYDNDGYVDIFIANGHGMPDFDNPRSTIGQRNQLFRNSGDGTFLEVYGNTGYGLRLKNSSRGVAKGDFDNDGDIDILVTNNNGYATLLKNDAGNVNNWLNIKLVGTKSNRDAIGARVRVTAGQMCQTRELRCGSGYLSQSDIRLCFGLGGNSKAGMVEIRWPSGNEEIFHDVLSNQFIEVVEGRGSYTVVKSMIEERDKALSQSTNSLPGQRVAENSVIRQRALIALGSIGDERAVGPLILCVRDPDPGVRCEAVKALRYFNNDRAIEQIMMALADNYKEVRREAATTLGHLFMEEQTIRKASIQRKRLAVPLLLRALEDEDPIVRHKAAKALGYSESYRASIPVIEMLEDINKEVRKAATVTLGLLRDKRAIVPLMRIVKDSDEDASVRAKALLSLKRLESTIVAEPLFEILKEMDGERKQRAASVFAALFEDEEGVLFNKDETIQALIEAMNDTSSMARREVVKALGLIKEREQVRNQLIQALTDEDGGVRLLAVKALRSYGDKGVLPHIENTLKDRNGEVRREGVLTLGSFNDSKYLPCLMKMLQDRSFEVREQAAKSLGTFRDKETTGALLSVIKNVNEHKRVRRRALSTLCTIDADTRILIDLLEDSDSEIRKRAVRCLGVLKENEAIEPLINSLSDEDREVRREVVLALGGFKVKRVLDVLAKVLLNQDEDLSVRSAAVSSMSQFGNKKALFHLLKVLKSRGDKVRLEVVKSLPTFKDELTFKNLVMIIENRSDEVQVRAEAITALSQIDRERSVAVLVDLISLKSL